MRLFMGVSFPLRLGVLTLALLSFRPFAFLGSQSLPIRFPEALVARMVFGTMFHYAPEIPAVLEHLTGRDFPGIGDCRIVNVRALGGTGRLVVGSVQRANGTVGPHVWGESPAGERVDVACPTCQIKAVHAILTVDDYTLTNIEVVADGPPDLLPENIRYLKAALLVEKTRALLGLSMLPETRRDGA